MNQPPPPPPPYDFHEPQKKKTSPLVYFGIGCGALALLAVIGLFAGIGWGVKKAGGFISEVQKNPEKFAAEMIVKANPELELITSDEATGQITFRNTKSGETVTLSNKDVAEGKLTVTRDGEEIILDGSTEGGSVRVKTAEGESVLSAGQPVALPAWLPVMEGLTLAPAGMKSAKNGRETIQTTATAATTATIESIATFYSDSLDKEGFTVSREQHSAGDFSSQILQARDTAGNRNVTVAILRADKINPINVTFIVESPAAE